MEIVKMIKMIPFLHIFVWILRTAIYQSAEAHPGPS